jgi:hypothetical protein
MAEWREVGLEEILTKEQLKELKELVEEMKAKKVEPFSLEYTKRLRELLKKWEKELMEKEIHPDFLAYAISFKIYQNPEAFLIKLKQLI